MFDIALLLKESALVLRKNYTLAIPTVVAVFIVSFISLAVAPTPEDAQKVVIAGLVSMLLGLYAHGITLAMAREALETGSTSLGTAAFIASRLSGTFLFAAVIVGALVGAGSMIFLLPGLLAAFFLMFTFPSIVVDSVGAVEAVKRSISVTRTNLKESAMLFSLTMALGLGFGIANIIVSTIPVLGQLVGVALSGAFGGFISVMIIRAYKTLKRSSAMVKRSEP
jgi:hypothetical protein